MGSGASKKIKVTGAVNMAEIIKKITSTPKDKILPAIKKSKKKTLMLIIGIVGLFSGIYF